MNQIEAEGRVLLLEHALKDVLSLLEKEKPCCSCCGGDGSYEEVVADVRAKVNAALEKTP